MPGFLIHMGAVILCIHAGQAQPVATNPRVKVSGQPIVTQGSPYVVAGCGLTGTTAPPCATANWVMGATRVLSNGMPVLLQDSQAICAPSGAILNVLVTQTRVRGI